MDYAFEDIALLSLIHVNGVLAIITLIELWEDNAGKQHFKIKKKTTNFLKMYSLQYGIQYNTIYIHIFSQY